MHKILWSLLLLLGVGAKAQSNTPSIKLTNGIAGTSSTIRIRCAASNSSEQPLFVVDGVPLEKDVLQELNPNDIEAITVLKGTEATAIYGCRADRGVILITTKKASVKTFQVVDAEDGQPVSDASIQLVRATRDTIRLAANSRGEVRTQTLILKKAYKVLVSSVGYQPMNAEVTFADARHRPTIKLNRRENSLSAVTVIGYKAIRCRICCGLYCRISRHWKDSVTNKVLPSSFRLYPNPALPSSTINIETAAINSGMIELLTSTGQMLHSQNITQKQSIMPYTLPHLAAGIYFIRLVDGTSKKAQTQKLLIQ